MRTTKSESTIPDEQFAEVANQVLDDFITAILATGTSRSLLNITYVGEMSGCGEVELNGAMLLISRTTPKSPRRFLDFVKVRVHGCVPLKNRNGIYVNYGSYDAVELKFKPKKNGFMIDEIVASFKELADRIYRAKVERWIQEEEVRLAGEAGNKIVSRLAEHFGIKVNQYDELDWSNLMLDLEVRSCHFYQDKVLVTVPNVLRLNDGALRLSTLVALAAALPVDPLICNPETMGHSLVLLLTEEQAKTVIPALVEILKPLVDAKPNPDDMPELREYI